MVWMRRGALAGVVMMMGGCASTTPVPTAGASATTSTSAATATASERLTLRFAWPAGSEATVEETVTEKGPTRVERYRVRRVEVEGSPGLANIVVDELHIAALDGGAIDTDARRDEAARIEQLGAAMPSIRIHQGAPDAEHPCRGGRRDPRPRHLRGHVDLHG